MGINASIAGRSNQPISFFHADMLSFCIPEQPRLSKIDEVELALALLAADHKIFGFDVSVQLAFTVQTFYPIHHLNCKHYNGLHGKLASAVFVQFFKVGAQ